jgi:hypothetical protein
MNAVSMSACWGSVTAPVVAGAAGAAAPTPAWFQLLWGLPIAPAVHMVLLLCFCQLPPPHNPARHIHCVNTNTTATCAVCTAGRRVVMHG